jgi:hypothetical protein
MSKAFKKPFSFFLALIIFISTGTGLNISASANQRINPEAMSFEQYIVAHLEDFRTSIDVSHYLPQFGTVRANNFSRDADVIGDKIINEYFNVLRNNPQLFHVGSSIGFEISQLGNVTTVILSGYELLMTRSQYNTAKREFDRAVNRALAYARNAETDFDKALLLHDYLVLNIVYDKANLDHVIRTGNVLNPHSHTAYGAMVRNLAVCDGYARAYHYLLSKVGVESLYVEGVLDAGPHIWNLVKINNAWFHVDVTADDPLLDGEYDLHGIVSRQFFLVSDAELRRLGEHTITSAPERARQTTYDRNAFFRDVNSAIVILGDFYYWIEHTSTDLNTGTRRLEIRRRHVNSGATTTLHRFETEWFEPTNVAGQFSFFDMSFSSLASHNGILYYNTGAEIRSFNPATNTDARVLAPPNLGGMGSRHIYGLTMSGRTITYTIKTSSNSRDVLSTRNIQGARATGITLNANARTMNRGDNLRLTATQAPAGTNDFIHWVSSNPRVATVNANGQVTARGRGTATITAHSDSGRSASITITVR